MKYFNAKKALVLFKNTNDQIIIEIISWNNLCQYSTFYLFNLYLYAIKFTLSYKLLKIF